MVILKIVVTKEKPEMIVTISNAMYLKDINNIIHAIEKEHSDNYTLKFQINI